MLISYDWQKIEKQHADPFISSINSDPDNRPVNPQSADLQYSYLPFYNDTQLVQVNDSSWPDGSGPCWYLVRNNVVRALNGKSMPIHDTNDAERVIITADNVLQYLDFFCYFVHGNEGPFFIITGIDHPALDIDRMDESQKLEIEKFITHPELEILESGDFYARAHVLYGNALFRSIFSITHDGIIDMLDDEPLAGGIPVKKIKPVY